MSKKLHNPKLFAPSVYIPCWLIQVPISLLSHGAKITYGRLSQWADNLGHAYRSSKNLAQELGTSEKSIERYIKELRDNGLIGTYQPQAGGINHFEFYDHEWMHSTIKEQLVYKEDRYTPPSDLRVPLLRSEGPPSSDLRDINNIEIKEIKCVGAAPQTQKNSPLNLKKQQAEQKALNSESVKNLFNEKFFGYEISIETLFAECQEHYEQKSLWATQDKFLKWIKSTRIENYKKEIAQEFKNKIPTKEDFENYKRCVNGFEWVGGWLQKQKQG